MDELSILIGGKAGFGIDRAGAIIGNLMNKLGWRIFIYRDYPSLIRGGHTFLIVRASKRRIAAHRDAIDIVIALNEETLSLHKKRLKDGCLFIYDSDQVKPKEPSCGVGLGLGQFLKEENAPEIMRNTCVIGAMAKALGISFDTLSAVLAEEFSKEAELNIKVARRGYDASRELIKVDTIKQGPIPLATGNEAVGLGLVKGGLNVYIAYPMTPGSPILHYLAKEKEKFSIDVIHPESEIAVILMALGFAYAGRRAAVGTSGGGFCLMTEGLSLSGMAELPVTIVLGQRPGPSTGLPTYTSQTELNFALYAGQGEFARFIVAPGDAEEAYYWSAVAMEMSWRYQVPSIILTDKHIGESAFNFDIASAGEITRSGPALWDRNGQYKRYAFTDDGVSPLAFPPAANAVVKVNSYEHDESGITTEEPEMTKAMQEKRLKKEKALEKGLKGLSTVKVYGNKKSKDTVLFWGSNKGACVEIADKLGMRAVQPIVLNPFPEEELRNALAGAERVIAVECNARAQLAALARDRGFRTIDKTVLKYDGRPFSLEELEAAIKEKLR